MQIWDLVAELTSHPAGGSIGPGHGTAYLRRFDVGAGERGWARRVADGDRARDGGGVT